MRHLAMALMCMAGLGVPVAFSQSTADTEQSKPAASSRIVLGEPVRADALRDERKAAKLYLAGVKKLEKQQPEAALHLLQQAADLEPGNATYVKAADLARQSAVTHLVQEASKARSRDAEADGVRLLQQAMALDPKNPLVVQHLDELADKTQAAPVGGSLVALQAPEIPLADGAIKLEPSKGKHSFHLHMNAQLLVKEVFKAYGIDASLHDSVNGRMVRLDVDDVLFADAVRVLGLVTDTFYEPLDPHRVVVARDTRANRDEFERQEVETLYLPGLTDKELNDVSTMAKNVFGVRQTAVEISRDTLTVKAPTRTMTALNRTISSLMAGNNQLDLDVKVIQLSHISTRDTGTKFFQQTGVYNVYSELQTIIQQNQSLVNEIISQGLVPNANTVTNQLAIVAILLASGQLTGTPFNAGYALFGNGLTTSAITPGPATLNFSLNSSDTRLLDDIHLRLSDDEAGTFKIGQRYPIETSSFSSAALPSIPGLTSALSSVQAQTVPQIQYQDLGLTLKATPKVLRSKDVTLSLELKIESLGGSSLNDIPVLNSQQFSGVLSVRSGETAVLLSDLSRQEARALDGLPGVSDIPGLQDVSDISRNQNVARLLILVTPSVLRGPQEQGHGPRLMVDKQAGAN